MNVIARLEFELAYYDSAVHRFNHYTMRTPSQVFQSNSKNLHTVIFLSNAYNFQTVIWTIDGTLSGTNTWITIQMATYTKDKKQHFLVASGKWKLFFFYTLMGKEQGGLSRSILVVWGGGYFVSLFYPEKCHFFIWSGKQKNTWA